MRINNYWVVVKPLEKDTLFTRSKMESGETNKKRNTLWQTILHVFKTKLLELQVRGMPKRPLDFQNTKCCGQHRIW